MNRRLITNSFFEEYNFFLYEDKDYEYEEIIWHDGSLDAFKRDKITGRAVRHCLDGAACIRIYNDGSTKTWYYIEGIELTKDEWINKPSWVLNKYF